MAFLDETGLAELWSLTKDCVNWYVWEKTKSETSIVTTTSGSSGAPYSSAYYIQCSKSVAIENGQIVLVDPVQYSLAGGSNSAILEAISGGYFISNVISTTKVLKDNGTVFEGSNFTLRYYELEIKEVTTSHGYVSSSNPNAYPIDDGYTYVPMGQLGEKTRIATGSYTGTDTYGASNPNSLTFDFEPKLVIVRANVASNSAAYVPLILVYGTVYTGFYWGNTGYALVASWNGKKVSWYSERNSPGQLNELVTYNYIAIG